jgi:hypothetical protein
MTAHLIGASPEYVLVFETIGPPKDFLNAIAAHPDLEWLFEKDELIDPDLDFFHKSKPAKQIATCVYMVMFNQAALEQLLSIWILYKNKSLPRKHKMWTPVFQCLHSIRRWGPTDRLRELDQLKEALEPIQPDRLVPIEIEFWPRQSKIRSEIESNLERIVVSHGGKVLDRVQVSEIRYHAVLVELPHAYLNEILALQGVDLVELDDIYLIRPVSQCSVIVDTTEAATGKPRNDPVPTGNPVCALLDGLPMENHPELAGRLLVDDPDDWASTYAVSDRRHGTAMASLIVHGDLADGQPAIQSPLYVRPILKAADGQESAPRSRLWLDLIHQAILRMVSQGTNLPAVAPSVRIVNLSVGDRARPFLREPSPVARLLDWLAWKHKLLFVVSAGNHVNPVPSEVADSDLLLLQHQIRETRHRRLLSPAETINGLTVGSLNQDQPIPLPTGIPGRVLPQRTDLPAAYSAFGRGVRRSVKPDLLAPGGRQIFRRRIPSDNAQWEPIGAQSVLGQTVAAPGPPGEPATVKTIGTSNAAALVSSAAIRIHDKIVELLETTGGSALSTIPIALLIKTLLVHTADWQEEAGSFVVQALNSIVDPSQARDHASGILGYGGIRPEQGLGCSPTRATAVGGGTIRSGQALRHDFPLPECMHAKLDRRRLTATLAWLTPINPGDRKYRVARLHMAVPKGSQSPLLVKSCQVHGNAIERGTVQHMVLECDGAAMNILHDALLPVTVTCSEDAGGLTMPVHYGLAISLEMAPALNIPIYEQVAQRLRVRAPVPVRVGQNA